MLSSILLYLFFGAISGVVAGLFGVGGGAILVPILIYAFTMQGFAPEVLTHMAVGTSLAVICFTSISSIRAHHQNGFVLWSYLKTMAPGLLIGVAIGVMTVVQIPGYILQWIIGIFLCLVAVKMLLELNPKAETVRVPSKPTLFAVGGGIGWVSALFGIGGGTLTVPFLTAYGTRMQYAVATSAACGLPIALGGAISNMAAGWEHNLLPEMSAGYVYLPALLGLALMSMPFAKVGANLAKKLPATVLKRVFSIFLIIVGAAIILGASGVI